MTEQIIALSLLTLAACSAPEPARSPGRTTPTATAHARAVADLVGVWAGRAAKTPLGAFPMAIAFDRTADGAVHARLDGADGMYLDFRFHRDGESWLLTEEGYLPGVGTQRHVLAPVPGGTGARWVAGEKDEALVVDIAVDRRALRFATTLRGQEHAVFELSRMEGKDADEVRRRIASAAPGGDALSSPR